MGAGHTADSPLEAPEAAYEAATGVHPDADINVRMGPDAALRSEHGGVHLMSPDPCQCNCCHRLACICGRCNTTDIDSCPITPHVRASYAELLHFWLDDIARSAARGHSVEPAGAHHEAMAEFDEDSHHHDESPDHSPCGSDGPPGRTDSPPPGSPGNAHAGDATSLDRQSHPVHPPSDRSEPEQQHGCRQSCGHDQELADRQWHQSCLSNHGHPVKGVKGKNLPRWVHPGTLP